MLQLNLILTLSYLKSKKVYIECQNFSLTFRISNTVLHITVACVTEKYPADELY
jgi:hypothetical protein